jgi:hypothetical protein
MDLQLEVQEQQEATVIQDGFIVGIETGEVYGLAEQTKEFTVDSATAAEWVLEKLSEAEGRVVGLKAELAGVQERFASRIKDQERRSEWLRARFGSELEEFAKSQLDGKSKTWKGTFGSVAFRATSPRLVVLEQDKAVAFALMACPDAVKTVQSVLVSNIPENVKGIMIGQGAPDGFDVIPAGESVSIKTVGTVGS